MYALLNRLLPVLLVSLFPNTLEVYAAEGTAAKEEFDAREKRSTALVLNKPDIMPVN